MNEIEFRAYLKRNRRKPSAIDQIVSFARDYLKDLLWCFQLNGQLVILCRYCE